LNILPSHLQLHNINLEGEALRITLFLILLSYLSPSWASEKETRISSAPTLDPALVEEVSQSKYWLKLLHYKRNWPIGRLQSQLDGPEFFFAPDGNKNPKSELVETIHAFYKSDLKIGRLKQPPQCAFPERLRYLKTRFDLKVPEVPCPHYDEYLTKLKAKSASLVFSSAYPNNPGSMYGHTFLKIRSNQRTDLLDYGISYAAHVGDDSNNFEFIARGLTGGYPGQFSMLPYYAKVNEYIKSESRDLWEYDLNLNEEETQRMIAHLWELETTSWFDYYFFDENCSFQILAALEIAKPDWELATPNLFTIPAETIKKLASIPGAITQIKYRPSLRNKMQHKYEILTGSERSDFFDLIRFRKTPESIASKNSLDAATAYFQYRRQGQDGKLTEEEEKTQKQILLQRSALNRSIDSVNSTVSSSDQEDSNAMQNRPELGHNPTRIGTSSGFFSDSSVTQSTTFFQEFNFKFAYHDLMNNDLGYIPFSHIDFPAVTLRYIPELSKLNIENITAFSLTSLFPLSFLDKKPSWKLTLDYYSPKDFGCIDCHAIRLESGAGTTINLFSPKYIWYTLLTANAEVGSTFQKGYRIGPKLQTAVLFNPIQIYKIRSGITLNTDLWQSDRQSIFYDAFLDQSLSLSQSFELRFRYLTILRTGTYLADNYRETNASLLFYF
jgi:hypothetical protein